MDINTNHIKQELTINEIEDLDGIKEGWRIPTLEEAILLYKSNLQNPINGLEEATRVKEEGEESWIFWTSSQDNGVHDLISFEDFGHMGPLRWLASKEARARLILIK